MHVYVYTTLVSLYISFPLFLLILASVFALMFTLNSLVQKIYSVNNFFSSRAATLPINIFFIGEIEGNIRIFFRVHHLIAFLLLHLFYTYYGLMTIILGALACENGFYQYKNKETTVTTVC